MEIGILLWIGIGLAGGWLAVKKGYSANMGVILAIILSIFCGPLALVVIALLPPTQEGRQQALHEQQMSQEQAEFNKRRACPACHEQISARAIVCGLCGRHLS